MVLGQVPPKGPPRPLRFAAARRYQIEVHDWAGAPGTRVDLTPTDLNSLREAG